MTPAQPAKKQQPETAPMQKKMTLANVQKGKRDDPMRVLVYGVPGSGKSTFASNAPSPIFLCPEDGVAHLDVARFPIPETWNDAMEAVRSLTDESHTYRTLVVDTLDALEQMCWQHVVRKEGKHSNIEEVGGGYQKGYRIACDEWRLFLAALERLRAAKGMHVVFVAHSWVKTFKNPQGGDFDKFEVKLQTWAASLLREWSDAVLFLNYAVRTEEKAKRLKGVTNGARLLYTTFGAAWEAKNRWDLPDMMDVSWPDFEAAVRARRPADPTELIAEIERKAKQLGCEEKLAKGVAQANGDAAMLAKLNDWLNARLYVKGE